MIKEEEFNLKIDELNKLIKKYNEENRNLKKILIGEKQKYTTKMLKIIIKFKVRRGKTKVKKAVIKARTKLTLAEFESPRVAMQNELISKNTAVILKPC